MTPSVHGPGGFLYHRLRVVDLFMSETRISHGVYQE
jgi:hypothetical protein